MSKLSTTTWTVAVAAVVAVVGGLAFAQRAKPSASSAGEISRAATAAPLHSVTIQRPAGPPRVHTGTTNFHGQAVTVACGTCHTTTQPNARTRTSAELDQFHQGLKYAHGELTCLSCHNAANYDALRLADGRSVEFPDVMTLCGQCHGPQLRDYLHGAHGGMTGHWDLSRGPRTRNNCVNCHDPHSPKYPLARPVFPPRDRISVPVKTSAILKAQPPKPLTKLQADAGRDPGPFPPHPGPLPLGEGASSTALVNTEAAGLRVGGLPSSLSQRERAGVRENAPVSTKIPSP